MTHDFCSSAAGRVGAREYFCKPCGCGPFHDKQSVETHISGRRHVEAAKKWGCPPVEPVKPEATDPSDPLAPGPVLRATPEASEAPEAPAHASEMLRHEMALAGLCGLTAPDSDVSDYEGPSAAEILREEMAKAKLCSSISPSPASPPPATDADEDSPSHGAVEVLRSILEESGSQGPCKGICGCVTLL